MPVRQSLWWSTCLVTPSAQGSVVCVCVRIGVCVCVCVYMCVCVCVCACTFLLCDNSSVFMCVYVKNNVCLSTPLCMYACSSVSVFIYQCVSLQCVWFYLSVKPTLNARMIVLMCVCVCVCVCVWFCLYEGAVPRAQMMFFLSVIPSQVILLADILPTLLIKSTAPFYIQRIPYRWVSVPTS